MSEWCGHNLHHRTAAAIESGDGMDGNDNTNSNELIHCDSYSFVVSDKSHVSLSLVAFSASHRIKDFALSCRRALFNFWLLVPREAVQESGRNPGLKEIGVLLLLTSQTRIVTEEAVPRTSSTSDVLVNRRNPTRPLRGDQNEGPAYVVLVECISECGNINKNRRQYRMDDMCINTKGQVGDDVVMI